MRRPIKKRKPLGPDPLYKSVLVTKLVNYVMEKGKKDTARRAVYDAFEVLKKSGDPLNLFETAIQNVQPSLEIRSRRVGGANYSVPMPVRPERQLALSLRWMRDAARSKKGIKISIALANEILAASKGEGEAIAKKENMHKMAEANKAFAHFAW